jgi:hypothetical protein
MLSLGGARCKVQGARCNVQGATCKVQGARCKVYRRTKLDDRLGFLKGTRSRHIVPNVECDAFEFISFVGLARTMFRYKMR